MIQMSKASQQMQVNMIDSARRFDRIQDILRSFRREPYTQSELGLVMFSLTTSEKKHFFAEAGRRAGDYGAFTAESRSDDYRRLNNVGVCIFTTSRPKIMEVVIVKIDETAGAVKGKPIAFRVFMGKPGAPFIEQGRAPSLSLALKLARTSVQTAATSLAS